ncbi:hypothetical protein QUB56_14715 [Microcoleus sp. AR_TQ3_B6]|uniref:hypothetical protein n=1 Tax=Microcoleus sp. AR_TQ3_B6 TaxID=3055284 RepID=UPI002FCE6A16
MFATLAAAVVSLDEVGFSRTVTSAREDSALRARGPERTFYAMEDGLSLENLLSRSRCGG